MNNYNYFILDEFLASQTALMRGIDNTQLSKDDLNNLDKLIRIYMDPLREYIRGPIIITSGYRCRELNSIVGGVHNSEHLTGNACDFYAPGMSLETAFNETVKFLKEGTPGWNQVIKERGWIHLGVSSKNEIIKKV